VSAFGTVLIDPPWRQPMAGRYDKPGNRRPAKLPYPTLTVAELASLPVGELAGPGSHLWLWTTNAFLRDGFDLVAGWGFRYLAPVVWVKPSGAGNWFVHRTQTLLFGYRKPLRMLKRFSPNVLTAPAGRHSEKPGVAYDLIEAVSPGPRIELFARRPRAGWESVGNEVDGRDIRAALTTTKEHEHDHDG